jgi:hypothetical protein
MRREGGRKRREMRSKGGRGKDDRIMGLVA